MATTQDSLTFNPKILQWALDIEGCTPEELAEKLKIPTDEINSLLTTKHKVQLKLVKQIARHLKFSSTVFFMSEPPYESRLSYAGIPGTPADKPSKKTLQAIRQAYYMQSVSNELLTENDYGKMEPDIERIPLQNPAAETARDHRKRLGFASIDATAPDEKRYAHMYDGLVERIEELGIFVHQIPMPVDEARGFALIDGLPRVIAVNAADSDRLKIFTLLHQYAHVLLKNTDNVCFPNYSLDNVHDNPVEKWCNDFAGSFLMPEEEFQKKLQELEATESDPKKIIAKLAERFYSDMHTVLVRLERLGKSQYYRDYFDEMKDMELFQNMRISKPENKTEEENRDSEITKCLNQRGRKLVNLVLESSDKGLATSGDIIYYLGLNPDCLDDLKKIL